MPSSKANYTLFVPCLHHTAACKNRFCRDRECRIRHAVAGTQPKVSACLPASAGKWGLQLWLPMLLPRTSPGAALPPLAHWHTHSLVARAAPPERWTLLVGTE